MGTTSSMCQTSSPRYFVCVFEPHYDCVVVGSADHVLASADIGGMDNHFHQVICQGYHHIRTVHIVDCYRKLWRHGRYQATEQQCLKFVNLVRKQLERLLKNTLSDFERVQHSRPQGISILMCVQSIAPTTLGNAQILQKSSLSCCSMSTSGNVM